MRTTSQEIGSEVSPKDPQGAVSIADHRQAQPTARANCVIMLPAFIMPRKDPRPGELLRDYWCVSETGDWEHDVAIGCAHAQDAIRLIRQDRAPHILNWIASEMVHKRRFAAVEVGFFNEIGALIVRTRR